MAWKAGLVLVLIALVAASGCTYSASEVPGTAEQQAIALAKSSFAYFPESAASASASKSGDDWLVEIKIPGANVLTRVVNIQTGSVGNRVGSFYKASVDTAQKAAELMMYHGKSAAASSIISNGTEWQYWGGKANSTYAISKETGVFRVVR